MTKRKYKGSNRREIICISAVVFILLCVMLVQSSQERTLLLPALPCEWKNGSIRGLRIMGGASIDLAWKDGTLTKAVLYDACEELEVCLVYQGEKKSISLKPGERKEW